MRQIDRAIFNQSLVFTLLGKDDEEPEFSDGSYFMMLFSAGIAIGLFYYGVAEPIFHYVPGTPNRYTGRYMTKCLFEFMFYLLLRQKGYT